MIACIGGCQMVIRNSNWPIHYNTDWELPNDSSYSTNASSSSSSVCTHVQACINCISVGTSFL